MNNEQAGQWRDLNVSNISGDFVLRNLTRSALQELTAIAVTAGIDAIDIGDLMEALPLCVARLGLQLPRNGRGQSAGSVNLTRGALSPGLHCLLPLPSNLLHCFVLRLLTGIALPICADLLQLASKYIWSNTDVAALELARAIAPNAALSRW